VLKSYIVPEGALLLNGECDQPIIDEHGEQSCPIKLGATVH
jgi:hypothetical protein